MRLKRPLRACIYRPNFGGVPLGKARSLPHAEHANQATRVRHTSKGLSEAGMVDLLGMFRRRPAKRSAPGFARSRADITALGDGLGEMLHSPVRDAPAANRFASEP